MLSSGSFYKVIVILCSVFWFSVYNSVVAAETLNLRLQAFNIYLNPPLLVDTDSRRIVEMLHARLIRTDKSGIIHPELAEAWSWDENEITFLIRDDATFSDGTDVTAEDAVYSLCQLLQQGSPYNWMLSSVIHEVEEDRVNCSGIKATSRKSLSIVVYDSGRGSLMEALGTAPASILPKNAAEPGEFGTLIGAGPYVLEEIIANKEILLRARTTAAIKPGVSKVSFKYIPDDQTAAEFFKAGSLDILEIFTPKLLDSVASVSDGDVRLNSPGRLYGTDVAQMRMLIINEERIASDLGIETERVAEFISELRASISYDDLLAVAGDMGRVSNSAFPPGEIFKKPTISAEVKPNIAGSLKIISTNDEYADLIASKLPKSIAGVKLNVEGLPKSVAVDKMINRDYSIINMWFEAIIDEPVYWAAFFTPGRPFTLFGKEIDGLEKIDLEDPNGLQLASELINLRGNWIPLFLERRYYAFQPGITDEQLLGTGLISYQGVKKR